MRERRNDKRDRNLPSNTNKHPNSERRDSNRSLNKNKNRERRNVNPSSNIDKKPNKERRENNQTNNYGINRNINFGNFQTSLKSIVIVLSALTFISISLTVGLVFSFQNSINKIDGKKNISRITYKSDMENLIVQIKNEDSFEGITNLLQSVKNWDLYVAAYDDNGLIVENAIVSLEGYPFLVDSTNQIFSYRLTWNLKSEYTISSGIQNFEIDLRKKMIPPIALLSDSFVTLQTAVTNANIDKTGSPEEIDARFLAWLKNPNQKNLLISLYDKNNNQTIETINVRIERVIINNLTKYNVTLSFTIKNTYIFDKEPLKEETIKAIVL